MFGPEQLFNILTPHSNKARRPICLVLVGLLITSTWACNKVTSHPTKEMTVVSFGGAYQTAQRKAYFSPFQAAAGIKLNETDYNGDFGLLKSRALASEGPWDVVSVEAAVCARGTREKIFTPINYSIVDKSGLLPGAALPDCVGHLVFSTVLAYDTKVFSSPSDAPTTWKDFFDIQKFPGKRGLRNNPRGTLEIALLGSGTPPDKLYPLDVDAAFQALDRLKPYVELWESGAQPVQLITNGTVTMSSAYNGRIWDAQIKERLPLGWSWDQGLMEMEYWSVPANSRKKDEAMRFIAFSLKPIQQSRFTNEIAYGPTSLDAIHSVKAEVLNGLPNSPKALPLQIPVNPSWWAEHEREVASRWQVWTATDK